MEDQESFEQKIGDLLKIYEKNRNEIMLMIDDLEKLKNKLDTIFPETADARYMRFFEDKVKAVSSFFNVLLDMRKEINKSVKDEIEIRRKTDNKENKLNLDGILDIRGASRKLDKFKKSTEKMKSQRLKNIKKMELPEGVGVPGINANTEGV